MNRTRIVLTAALLGSLGWSEAAEAQLFPIPERQLFAPMGEAQPLYESDLLTGSSAAACGLEGAVRAVTLTYRTYDTDETGIDVARTVLWFTRDGFLTRVESGSFGDVELELEFKIERVDDGRGDVVRLTAEDVGDRALEDTEKPLSMMIEHGFNEQGGVAGWRMLDGEEAVLEVTPGDAGIVWRMKDRPTSTYVVGEAGRLVEQIGGPWGRLRLDWDGDRVEIVETEEDRLLVRMRVDEHGDPVESWGPYAGLPLGPRNDDAHSRRTFERDAHGNWTSMLVEHELEDGWTRFVLFEREITYWDE